MLSFSSPLPAVLQSHYYVLRVLRSQHLIIISVPFISLGATVTYCYCVAPENYRNQTRSGGFFDGSVIAFRPVALDVIHDSEQISVKLILDLLVIISSNGILKHLKARFPASVARSVRAKWHGRKAGGVFTRRWATGGCMDFPITSQILS